MFKAVLGLHLLSTSFLHRKSRSKRCDSGPCPIFTPPYSLQFDLPKKRTCTFGLHGPWGEGTSVFIRVSFTFPRDYPQASYPGGIPQVDLEKNPLIHIKTRIHILRRLRAIRERQRPCLEACLRFLLFGYEDESAASRTIESESSSDEAYPPRRTRGATVSLLRGDKNLAEPRTSQGVFGANGKCFKAIMDLYLIGGCL